MGSGAKATTKDTTDTKAVPGVFDQGVAGVLRRVDEAKALAARGEAVAARTKLATARRLCAGISDAAERARAEAAINAGPSAASPEVSPAPAAVEE